MEKQVKETKGLAEVDLPSPIREEIEGGLISYKATVFVASPKGDGFIYTIIGFSDNKKIRLVGEDIGIKLYGAKEKFIERVFKLHNKSLLKGELGANYSVLVGGCIRILQYDDEVKQITFEMIYAI